VSPLKKVSSITFLAFDLWWGILKSLFIGEAFIRTQDLGATSNGGVELKYGLDFSLPFTPSLHFGHDLLLTFFLYLMPSTIPLGL
jgi:hypothetical protein